MNKLLRAHTKGPAAPPQHLLLSPEGSFNFISIIKDSLVQSANEASAVRLQRVACPGCCKLLGCPRTPSTPQGQLQTSCSDRAQTGLLREALFIGRGEEGQEGRLLSMGANVGQGHLVGRGSRKQCWVQAAAALPGERDRGQGPDLGLPAQE